MPLISPPLALSAVGGLASFYIVTKGKVGQPETGAAIIFVVGIVLLAAAIFVVANRLVDIGAILFLLLSVKVLLTRLFKPVALTRWLLPVETKAAELVN